jgi:uncharacterized protein (TIGR03437 family)
VGNVFYMATGAPAAIYDLQSTLATDTYKNNIFYTPGPALGVNGIDRNWDWAASLGSVFVGNQTADPMFVAADPSWKDQVDFFDFRTQDGSPANGLADPSATPLFDVRGYSRAGSYDAGAYVRASLAGASVPLSVSSVVNAASRQPGAVAPGEYVLISGTGMGPLTTARLQVDSQNVVMTTLAGTQVLFNGVPAPLIDAQSWQVITLVPSAVSLADTAKIEVVYNGQVSQSVTVPVAQTAPGLFTSDSSGTGQGSFVNQDGTFNSSLHPALGGWMVSLYATGGGLLVPGGPDGILAASPPPNLTQPVTATVGGAPATVLSATGVTGNAAGLIQVNLKLPNPLPNNDGTLPVVLTIGGIASQAGVTLAVK